jgi:hypothetical protein
MVKQQLKNLNIFEMSISLNTCAYLVKIFYFSNMKKTKTK